MTKEERIKKEIILERLLKRISSRSFYDNMIADAQLILKLAIELQLENLQTD